MKYGLFQHGGQTRKMLSIEIGRAAKRDDKVETVDEVLAYVRAWLERDGIRTSEPPVRLRPQPGNNFGAERE